MSSRYTETHPTNRFYEPGSYSPGGGYHNISRSNLKNNMIITVNDL